jgi:hypothetical protein
VVRRSPMLFIVMMSSSKREPVSAARLRLHGRLEPPVRSDVLVSVSVGPSGEAVAVWEGGAGRPALLPPGWVNGPSSVRPVAARVTMHGAGADVAVPIADLGMPPARRSPCPTAGFWW